MTGSTSIRSRVGPVPKGLQELIDAYSETHGVDVWFWQRTTDGWALAASTAPPSSDRPGASAVPITVPHVASACVEVSGGYPERAAFLATVLGLALQHHAESRLMGRELAERYEEITLLYTISEVLGSVISLEEAAETILGEVVDTMGVRRAALWIHDPELDHLELVAAVGGGEQTGPIRLDDSSSVTAAVFRERRPKILERGDVYPRESPVAPWDYPDSFMSVPLSYTPPHGDPRTIGVINLIGRTIEEHFSAGDQKLITAIASQIGAAVENSRLVADSLSQERIVREMELAHDLQLKLLPSTEQFDDYAEVGARCIPVDSVGGDFYHLFRLPGGRMGVMIGDVSSHGFGAALIMALTMSAVAIHASEGDPPAEVLRRAHQALIGELETTEMYVTLFYGVIDPVAGELTFANAGHSYAFRITADGQAERLPATNPPFGIVDLDNYGEQSIAWSSGDLLFLFTDGLSESIGKSRGEEVLLQRVIQSRDDPVNAIIQSLFDLDRGTEVPFDDRTAVLVRI
jgi:phosphoserine phosphatase RsbU/P